MRSMIIPSGGSGSRMGSNLPKQYLEIGGRPILSYTIEAIAPFVDLVVVAAQRDYFDRCISIARSLNIEGKFRLVLGGETRFHSVQNALCTLPDKGLIGIHDAVRPWVSASTIEQCFEGAEKVGASVPVVPLVESIRRGSGTDSRAVDRSEYRAVRTPQVFRASRIKRAYDTDYSPHYTDDCSVYERLYSDLLCVEDSYRNVKITTPEDLLLFHRNPPR